jgi:penicillin-binding protein 1B
VDGIVTADLDPDTQELATFSCPRHTTEVFIAGSQPSRFCRLHGGGRGDTLLATNVAGWDSDPPKAEPDAESQPDAGAPAVASGSRPPKKPEIAPAPAAEKPGQQKEKKKGIFGRIFDVFR